MRIALATKSVPFPLTNGSSIRNYQLIRLLSARHEITLITFVRSDEEIEGLNEMAKFCSNVIAIDERRSLRRKARDVGRCIATGIPYTVCAHTSVRFRAAIAAAAQNADVLQLQELYLTANLPRVRIPVVLDAHNVEATILERMARVEHRQWRRRIYAWQAGAMDRYERSAVPRFAGVIALSELERLRFQSLHKRVVLAPNGVECRAELANHTTDTKSIVFVGTLEYAPNRDAVEYFIAEIFPLIERRVPQVEFRIIGTKPRWADAYAGRQRVRFLGRIRDLEEEFARAALMVVPLRAGGGTRLKILDAFTAGVPVVSTAIGAEGIGVTDGIQLLVREAPEQFAEAVCGLLENAGLRHELADRAFSWSQNNLSWESIVASLEPFYESLVREL